MSEKIIVNDLVVDYDFYISTDEKPVVVLLHGWGVSKEVWENVYTFLIGKNFSCLKLDFPGFGGTSTPKVAWSVDNYANFIVEFFRKLNITKVILVGHSFGGRVSLVVAATYPNLVNKLVLVDSAGIKTGTPFKKVLSVASKFVKPLFRFRFTNPLRKKIYRGIGAEDYVATPELNKTFVKVIGEDLTRYLPKIQQLTKILWGKNDIITPVSYAETFKKGIKNSSVVIFENAGHYCFIDKPEKFYKELLSFIL